MRGVVRATVLVMVAMLGCGGGRESNWETTPDQPTVQTTEEERTSLSQQAAEAWAGRDDEASIRRAVELYGQLNSAEPNNAEHAVWLSRSNYFLADCHLSFDEAKKEEMMSTYDAGTRAAERALVALSSDFADRMRAGTRIEEAVEVLDATAVPALYWRASNLGKWASADGFATLLSYKDEIRAVMGRCLELDREFFYYGPDRYFGVFYGRAPSFAGGDVERSREHFETSLRHHPNYFATRVLMAQDYATKAQDRAVFEEQLNTVINGDPEAAGPELGPENRCEQRKARNLITQADDLFE
ncbi:MAG: hypothetical protein H6722_17870 [Sandaracinus sp.]|nr:hypothetical protein [Myxococcales bacterium]MCB9614308.1 hypothetical protein [Sandaracinus sp.]